MYLLCTRSEPGSVFVSKINADLRADGQRVGDGAHAGRPDDVLDVRLDAYPQEVFEGKVDHITFESKLENNVNVYAIDILPEKVPESFRSGMTSNVTFIVKEQKQVLLVPSEAIMEWPKTLPKPKDAVFAVYKKVWGGELKPVPVKIGESDGRMTEITEGLKEGMKIVIIRKKQKAQSTNPFSPRGAPKKDEAQKRS